jgi:colicin import membrane protein
MIREENWYKMLTISTVLHILALGIFSIPMSKSPKRLDLSSSYSVNLVGDIGGTESAGGIRPENNPLREKRVAAPTPPTPSKTKTQATVKTRPVPLRKERDLVSLAKKRPPAAEIPSREELTRLDETLKNMRIREMRRKTQYLDVAQAGKSAGLDRQRGEGASGLPFAGEAGDTTLDPAMQQYMRGIWERIRDAWGLPGMSTYKKNLEMIVTIRIRKDGRMIGIDVEKRSGNRVYDESVLRVLRSVDPLPPIPASLNMDSLEIGFRFMPGDLS